MSFTEHANQIFVQTIKDYHITDNVDTPIKNPYQERTIDNASTRNAGLTPFSGTSRTSSATPTSTPLRH